MKPQRILFIDRDGTLIKEPDDEQIDSFEKLEFVPGVFQNLRYIKEHLDYKLVMMSSRPQHFSSPSSSFTAAITGFSSSIS